MKIITLIILIFLLTSYYIGDDNLYKFNKYKKFYSKWEINIYSKYLFIWWYNLDIKDFYWFDIEYNKKNIKDIKWILKLGKYNTIHLWHKMKQEDINNFPKMLENNVLCGRQCL